MKRSILAPRLVLMVILAMMWAAEASKEPDFELGNQQGKASFELLLLLAFKFFAEIFVL